MALSNGRGGFNSGPMIFLSPRTKDADGHPVRPHFTVDRKDETGEFVRDKETVSEVSGDLFRVEIKRREYNGDPKVDAVLYLRDNSANPPEAYRLPITLNMPGRDLINRLANLTEGGDFTGLTVSYYENKKGYDAFSLEQRGERVQWKHDRANLPEPFAITDPRNPQKVIKRDYQDLNRVFEEEVEAIAAKLGQASAEKPAAAAPAAEQSAPAPAAPRATAPKPAATPAPRAAAPKPAAAPAPKPAARTAPTTAVSAPKPVARPAPKAAPTPAPQPEAETVPPGDLDDGSVPF